MKYEVFSYRYAREILEHQNYLHAWIEIEKIVADAPVFIYPQKSKNNKRLYVVQQVMNTYFDRVFSIQHGWTHHPLATGIKNSQLKADYRKQFQGTSGGTLQVQTEVQLGNMSRWYTDIFKFQAAYSEKLIQLGLSIVPQQSLASKIDSNIVNFERAKKELPAAELSITLPIVLIGLAADDATNVINISDCRFSGLSEITGKNGGDNRRRIIEAFLSGVPMNRVSNSSPIGPNLPDATEEGEDDENPNLEQ
jgi:hypothetical protein